LVSAGNMGQLMPARGKLPRFKGHGGSLFHRGKFLDGTWKAYFAPGQAPDGFTDEAGYRKPLDWNRANSLLRAPQQVWITAAFIDAVDQPGSSHTDYPFMPGFSDDIPNYVLADPSKDVPGVDGVQFGPIYIFGTPFTFGRTYYWNDGHTEEVEPGISGWDRSAYTPGDTPYIVDSGGFGTAGSFDHGHIGFAPEVYPGFERSVPNWSYSEYQRLMPIFREAKERIEILRRGMTWVDIVDYSDHAKWPNDRFQNGKISNIGGSHWSYLVAPDAEEEGGFFGTNFLHLHFGVSGLDAANFDDTWFSSLITTDDAVSFEFAQHINGKARIVAAYSLFVGYTVYLYGVGTLGQQMPWAEVPPIPIMDQPAGTDFYYQVTPPDPPTETIIALENSRRTQLIDNTNNQILGYGTLFGTGLPLIADDLKNYGFRYKGDSSTILSADDLIKLIAAYYRFDPETGRDLG
jgi:hypothetical protein